MKKLLVAAVISTALMAAPACAQMYLGGGIGASRTDANEASWKVYGGYQFNPTWGLELGYTDLGRYGNADIESASLTGTGTLRLGESWSLLGKLGAASNRPRFADSGNHADLLIGVGIGYRMGNNLGLRLEYEDFGKLSNVGAGSNSRGSNLGLSLKYAY